MLRAIRAEKSVGNNSAGAVAEVLGALAEQRPLLQVSSEGLGACDQLVAAGNAADAGGHEEGHPCASRLLLLPEPESADEEPGGAEMAAALAFQLQRLEAMRTAGVRLMALPRLGRDLFARGAPETLEVEKTPVLEVTLYDLLKAYGEHRRRQETSTLTIRPLDLYSLEDALTRLSNLLGSLPDWATLASFLPGRSDNSLRGRSALAAHFVASLELVKEGRIELRQDGAFAPIWLRRVPPVR